MPDSELSTLGVTSGTRTLLRKEAPRSPPDADALARIKRAREFYHPAVSREQSEQMLVACSYDCYLVRKATIGDNLYTLSEQRLVAGRHQARHILIRPILP